MPTAEASARVRLLGLSGGAVPAPDVGPARLRRSAVHGESTTRHAVIDRPRRRSQLVVGRSVVHSPPGGDRRRVVKVESCRGARSGPPAVFQCYNADKEFVVLDFDDPGDLDRLHELVTAADVVVEAYRPRAPRDLGIDAESHAARGAVWTSLTGHRHPPSPRASACYWDVSMYDTVAWARLLRAGAGSDLGLQR